MSTGVGRLTIGCKELVRLLPMWLECGGYRSEVCGGCLRIYGDVGRIGGFMGRMFREMTLVGGEMRYSAGKGYVDVCIVGEEE